MPQTLPGETPACSTLNVKGRASDYISQSNLPHNVKLDRTTLAFSESSLKFILNTTRSPSACYELAVHQMCLVAEPPCDPDTYAPMLLCPETCRAFDELISSGVCDSYSAEIVRLLDSTSTLSEYRPFENHLRLFNCSNPLTYFQNSRVEICDNSPDSCTNLFSPATQSKSWFCMIHNYVLMISFFRVNP